MTEMLPLTARRPDRWLCAALPAAAVMLSCLPLQAQAQSAFAPPVDFAGRIRASAETPGSAIYPGSTVTLQGQGLVPGQALTVQRGALVLNADGPLVVGPEGDVSLRLTLPEDAAVGRHPLVILGETPSAATIFELKVSPEIPLSGEEAFEVASRPLVPGLYQSAYSAANDALFVAAAAFRPPSSSLVKVDPESLEILAEVTPPPLAREPGSAVFPGMPEGPVTAAIFGLAVDDAKNTIWATNTFHNAVAVYSQDDLSLIHQFEAGTVYHSRDVAVDGPRGRAYVSASATDGIHVFDTETFEKVATIEIASAQRGGDFSVMSLDLDAEGGRLFTVSRLSNELAVIDLDTNEVARVLPVPGAKNASGVAYDPEGGRIFVASQDSDNLVILDLESGDVLHDVPVGAGALNVAFEPVGRLAYVSNRGAGTVTIVSPDGEIVGNLAGGSYPNHVHADGKGNIFAVNKSLGEDDATGDHLTRIRAVE